jgi:inorganic pyrophosphatase
VTPERVASQRLAHILVAVGSDERWCAVEQDLWVIVEIPKGSRNKYEYDEEMGVFKLDRMLFSSVHYPADYGFIAETLGEDEDPVDALVMVGEATFPGVHINVKPIGLFKMWDEKGLDHKILCVPVSDPAWNWADEATDLPEHLLLEIEHFFSIYKDLEMKKTRVGGWEDAGTARRVIAEGRQRWAETRPSESAPA